MEEKKEISQKIINYALWYYLKYFPSISKLKQKIDFKFGPKSEKGQKHWWIFEDDINYIIEEKMWNILVEKQIITSTINNYINKWKNLFYIRSKLNEKLFIKEEYTKILIEDFDIDNTSLLRTEKVFKQINTLYKKNKSRSYIRNTFVERNLDAEIIDPILEEIFIDWEDDILKNELYKILGKIPGFKELYKESEYLEKIDFQEKQKIIQKLLSKWFWYWEIKVVMGL